jgi:hypothetical protein
VNDGGKLSSIRALSGLSSPEACRGTTELGRGERQDIGAVKENERSASQKAALLKSDRQILDTCITVAKLQLSQPGPLGIVLITAVRLLYLQFMKDILGMFSRLLRGICREFVQEAD